MKTNMISAISVHIRYVNIPTRHLSCSLLLLAKKEEVGPAGLGGASRPDIWPEFFKNFHEVLLDTKF